MVMSGKAAALWGAGVGWPGFMAVAKGPAGGRFIVPERRRDQAHPGQASVPEDADRAGRHLSGANGAHRFRRLLELRAGPASLPDDIAYKLARALHKGEAAIAKRLAQASETTAANTAAAAPKRELIHPGVLRYLTEIGLVK